jgi:hypothetical protein
VNTALRVAAAEKAEAAEQPTFHFMIRSVRDGGVMNGRRERLLLPPVASNLPAMSRRATLRSDRLKLELYDQLNATSDE